MDYEQIGKRIGKRRIAPYRKPIGFQEVFGDVYDEDDGSVHHDVVVGMNIALPCGHIVHVRGELPKKANGEYKALMQACNKCSFCRVCWVTWGKGHNQVQCDPVVVDASSKPWEFKESPKIAKMLKSGVRHGS